MDSIGVQPRDLVEAGLYGSEDEVVQAALRHLLEDRPDLRVAVAVHQYEHEQGITLARAAEVADVGLERMKEILVDRAVPLRLGPATIEEAKREVATVERWFDADR